MQAVINARTRASDACLLVGRLGGKLTSNYYSSSPVQMLSHSHTTSIPYGLPSLLTLYTPMELAAGHCRAAELVGCKGCLYLHVQGRIQTGDGGARGSRGGARAAGSGQNLPVVRLDAGHRSPRLPQHRPMDELQAASMAGSWLVLLHCCKHI